MTEPGTPLRIAVLASGRGSNLRAIQASIDAGACAARIASVVSDRPNAQALDFAAKRDIETAVCPLAKGDDRDAWNVILADAVTHFEPELVVLAGFMRILGGPFLRRFPNRIVNVHPSLLPSFPGADAPQQAVNASVKLSGCTVHLVDDGVDTGPILAQAAVPVAPTDDGPALHARIQRVEHQLLPRIIDAIARGDLTLDPPTWRAGFATDGALAQPPLSATASKGASR